MRMTGRSSRHGIFGSTTRAALMVGGAIAALLSSAPLDAQANLPTTACRNAVTQAEPNKLPVVKANEQFACLTEVADKFQTAGQTVTQDFIPAAPGCSTDQAGHPNATRISVTAYTNAGNLDFEQDFKRKDGFVVAKIVNNTRCQTRGIKLKPGRTYFWVVENRGTSARLVAADDDIKLQKFTSCGAQGLPGQEAQARPSRCSKRKTPIPSRVNAIIVALPTAVGSDRQPQALARRERRCASPRRRSGRRAGASLSGSPALRTAVTARSSSNRAVLNAPRGPDHLLHDAHRCILLRANALWRCT